MTRKITLDWGVGTNYSLTKEAIVLAKLTGMKVSFPFNGVTVNVTKDTDLYTTLDKITKAVQAGGGSVYGEGW